MPLLSVSLEEEEGLPTDVMEDRGVEAVRGPSEVSGGLGADRKAVAFVLPTAACKEGCSACDSLPLGR